MSWFSTWNVRAVCIVPQFGAVCGWFDAMLQFLAAITAGYRRRHCNCNTIWPDVRLSGRMDSHTHWKRNESNALPHWKDIPISYLCVVKPRAIYLSIIFYFIRLCFHATLYLPPFDVSKCTCIVFFFLTNGLVFSSFLLQSLSWWRIIFPLA